MPRDFLADDLERPAVTSEPEHILLLRRARKRIRFWWRWARDDRALNWWGCPLEGATDPGAFSFCPLGALDREVHDRGISAAVYERAVNALGSDIRGENARGHKFALARFDSAIAAG